MIIMMFLYDVFFKLKINNFVLFLIFVQLKLFCGDGGEMNGFKKTFNLKHLDMFSRGSTLGTKIKIWLFAASPACFHYDIEDDPDRGWARFWLAPHVDTAGQ